LDSHLKDSIIKHYHDVDPHKKVAFSKHFFFEKALTYMAFYHRSGEKKLLDIGCGYGYFLEMAARSGWQVNGVEITASAANHARSKLGNKSIFHGTLKEANYPENQFDVITLWDVLVMVDNPNEELKECLRALKKGGVIGIRVRNVIFQKMAYFTFFPVKKILSKLGLKNPTVFHPFCFTPRSIEHLLLKLGFTRIRICNSPLTSGDAYRNAAFQFPIKMVKALIHFISYFVFWASRGRHIIGPSLLVWAEKS
jgi:2-polyprenyl-3-methyl-5-hydroxy-6-metoxy-1,4-benzoquinol methylase